MSIPREFHFIFGLKPQNEPFHLAHYLCLASCLEVNRPDRLTLYYHYEPYGRYWDMIKQRIVLERVDLVPEVSDFRYEDAIIGRKYRYAHHSDFVRVEKLIERGGIYADIDTLFVSPVPDALYAQPVVMGREAPVFDEKLRCERPSVCNAFIMAERGAPFLVELRARMASALDGSWSAHSCFLIQKLADERRDGIRLEGQRSFYRFMWTREDLQLLFEGQETDLDGVYSIHLWGHLWWERKRRDFSSFNAGKLTERQVRKLDTTYNLIARRFLPPVERRWWKIA